MSTPAKHLGYADRNENFASLLDSQSSYYEWAIVGLFYSALHIVKAYVIKLRGKGFNSHSDRNSFVARETVLKKVFPEYKHLYLSSRAARYNSRRFSPQEYRDHLDHLEKVENQVRPEIESGSS